MSQEPTQEPTPTSAAEEGRHRRPDGHTSAPTPEDRFPGDDAPEVVALRAEVAQTRENLARTVDQLHAKLDVKSRATASAHEAAEKVKGTFVEADGRPRPPAVAAVAVGALAGAVGLALWRRARAQNRRAAWWH